MITKTSEPAKQYLKNLEGLRLAPYRDTNGYWTVGFGHKLPANLTAEDLSKGVISLASACELFDNDLLQFERAVAPLGWLEQHHFDACVLLAYNIGAHTFATSHLYSALSVRNPHFVPLWEAWCHDSRGKVEGGLLLRRDKELRLFLFGEYMPHPVS